MKHQRLFELIQDYIERDEAVLYRWLCGETPTDDDLDTTKSDQLWDKICRYIDRHQVAPDDPIWQRVIDELDGQDIIESLYGLPQTEDE